MYTHETATSGIRPGPALLVMVLLSGCGGVGSGQEEGAAAAQRSREPASMQSAALRPVERPVAKPMDRGAERPASIHPVERPVAKPLDRPAHDEAQRDRS
jgi:hypothetical protein